VGEGYIHLLKTLKKSGVATSKNVERIRAASLVGEGEVWGKTDVVFSFLSKNTCR
jgi:hypothetical protein